MISALSKVITNPALVNIAQSTNGSVATKTAVNAVGRPGFILMDNNISLETKKFAATKEFLYQATCFLVYLALVVPVFKNGAFKVAKKYIYKGEEGFSKFKNAKEYLSYRKLAEKTMQNRTASLNKDHSIDKFTHDGLRENLLNNKEPEKYNKIKGAIELGNIIGSIVGLSILAPQVSNALIHPVLRFIGLEKANPATESKKTLEKENLKESEKVNTEQEDINDDDDDD